MNHKEVNTLPKLLSADVTEYIHRKLLACPRFLVVTNNVPIRRFQMAYGAADGGLIVSSYEDTDNPNNLTADNNNDPATRDLNVFAEMILELALNRCYVDQLPSFANIKIKRIFWNYYHLDSKGTFHIDDDDENTWSIILYLNTANGCGTSIKECIDGIENDMMISQVAGDAVLFPSSFEHAGTSANPGMHRCCVNILFSANPLHIKTVSNILIEEDNK